MTRPLRLSEFFTQVRWAMGYMWAMNRWLLIALCATALLISLTPAAIAWVGRELINAAVALVDTPDPDYGLIYRWLAAGLGIALFRQILNAIDQLLLHLLGDHLQLKVNSDILERAASLEIMYFEDPDVQDMAQRTQSNIAIRFKNSFQRLINTASALVQVVSLVSLLAFIEPIAAFVLVPMVLPYMVFRWSLARRRFDVDYDRATKRRWSNYFTSLLTSRNSIPELRLLQIEGLLGERFRKLISQFIQEDRRLYVIEVAASLVFSVVLITAMYALLLRVISLVVSSALTVGDIALFVAVTGRLQGALGTVTNSASNALEETLFTTNLQRFLNLSPTHEVRETGEGHPIRGDIRIEHLSFKYPGSKQLVIDDLSLHIREGETIALVGENGAGKTTLVKLLTHLYEPTQGTIYVDGKNYLEFPKASYQRQISFVMQGFNRYEATAFENIAFGDWEHLSSRADVEAVVDAAGIRSLIDSMPDGLDTMLGRRFGEYDLSGGQWQKIAIARALLRSGRLLILDEPTSNLDARAEYELFLRFKNLAKGRTTILISHRFSTVSMADRIVVLHEGQVAEMGTHDELLEVGGRYAQLYGLYRVQMGFVEA